LGAYTWLASKLRLDRSLQVHAKRGFAPLASKLRLDRSMRLDARQVYASKRPLASWKHTLVCQATLASSQEGN